ncbi:MAG: hypothetical protein AAGA22_07770 [Pseudomonadota bacterium]
MRRDKHAQPTFQVSSDRRRHQDIAVPEGNDEATLAVSFNGSHVLKAVKLDRRGYLDKANIKSDQIADETPKKLVF